MNTTVYTITDPDDEELSSAENIKQFHWDEIYLLISPYEKPNNRSEVLWVVEHGGVYGWMNLSNEMIPGDIVPYGNVDELPERAQRRFIQACFKRVN